MSSATPPTEYFPGINFNPSFYNLGSSAVSLDYLNSNFLRSTGYAISRAQFTLFNGSVDINENLDVSGNINASAYLVNNVPVSFSQWTTSGNDIYYNTGNVGIGKTNPSATYKLDVSGNINADKIFRSGTELTQYTDTNVRTVLSTSAGTNMTWNTGTNKFDVAAPYTDTNTRTVLSTSAGTNMTWNTGTNKFDVSVPPSYTDTNVRTVLSNSAGTNMTWNTGTNRFDVSVPPSYTDANVRTVLSNSAGTNMTWNTGTNKFDVNVISSQWTTTGTEIYYSTGKVGIGLTNPSSSGAALQINGTVSLSSSANTSFFWSGFTNTLIGRANTAGTYSSSAGVGDLVLSSNNNLIFKSGASTNPIAMCVDTSNNVGIGKTNPVEKLDVTGNIITSGNINLGNTSRSLYWGGTNSNLGRAGFGGEYSTSAVINDIVLRSSNKLILQSGVGAAGLIIDVSNNIGINTVIPSASLDIYKQHASGTNIDQFKMRYDTSWGLIFQQSFTGTGNIQYNVLNRYNNVNYNALTFQAGNVYIGSTTNSGTDDNTSLAFPDSTFFVRGPQTASSTTNITFRGGLQGYSNGKVKLWLSSDASHSSYIQNEHTGNGNTQLTFGTANGNALPTERLKISNTGIVSFSNDVWHGCLTGNHRLYFSPNNTTYLKGHGTIPLVFRRGDDAQIMKFSNNGAAAINTAGYATENGHMATGSLTIGNTSQNYGGGQYWNTNTAGLMLECADNTEIAVHDQGASIHSLMYYSTNGNITIGRNMGYNTANVNISGNLSVGGTNINSIIDQRIKNQHLFSLYRVSITYFNFIIPYWEGVWDFETNLKFNEYNRPQLNVRWNISGSINNGNGNDSNKYFFMNYFYNQLGNNIAFNTTHSYGTWTFQNYWNNQGNNYLRITCRLDAAADYLNINIS